MFMKNNKINMINFEKEKIKVFEAFAGYGGATYSLKRSKIPFEFL